MKYTIKMIAIVALISTFTVGCAFSQKLPSVTLGGAANRNAVVGAKCNKEELSVTAPLVNLRVPWPNAKVED